MAIIQLLFPEFVCEVMLTEEQQTQPYFTVFFDNVNCIIKNEMLETETEATEGKFVWTDASTKLFFALYKEERELVTNRKIKNLNFCDYAHLNPPNRSIRAVAYHHFFCIQGTLVTTPCTPSIPYTSEMNKPILNLSLIVTENSISI